MTYPGLSMWNESSKIHYFMDFWHFFCWRLWRPWMLLSSKSKGHKSKFRISWMYRFHIHGLKVHFWWPNKRLLSRISSLNTLYGSILTLIAVQSLSTFQLLFVSTAGYNLMNGWLMKILPSENLEGLHQTINKSNGWYTQQLTFA